MRFLLGSFRLVCLKVAAEHSSVSVRAMAADDQFELVAKASMGKGSSSAELGAMTDAPKRRGDEIESRPKARGIGAYASIPAPPAPELGEKMVTITFPEGIADLPTWGATLMTCGKVASERLSYEELRSSENADHVQYCKWLMARATTMKGQFKDFISYVQAYEAQFGKIDEQQLPVYIPGTKEKRILKKRA